MRALPVAVALCLMAVLAFAGSDRYDSEHSVKERAMTTVSAAILLSPDADGDAVARRFAALGLEAQRIGDDTILLTGPLQTFENALATPLTMSDEGVSAGEGGATVPLSHLPAELRQGVAEIGFETPPDFGPGNF
ncbi:hypothetical protein [Roseovarius sp. D22-M7]|uniref:hypothetical protein n=1 Tax=Roseovarius sp. D22-M7 TaxID=3127116 RepID=UPI0030101BB7